jgi:hypothetical protein
MKTRFDKKDHPRNFQKDDIFLMWNKQNEKVGKQSEFESLCLGPYKSEGFADNNYFYIRHLDGERLPFLMNGEVLKILYEGNI